jgi:hypothetical protein
MQRAMARQAEAEREKRAKIIHAEGEFQASKQLARAADIIAHEPVTLQLRYLQTLTEIATEKNSTVLFPFPMDIVKPFLGMMSTLEEVMARESRPATSVATTPLRPQMTQGSQASAAAQPGDGVQASLPAQSQSGAAED